jgi:hypothetical protein
MFVLARLAAALACAVLLDTQAHTPTTSTTHMHNMKLAGLGGVEGGWGGGGKKKQDREVGGRERGEAEDKDSGRNHHRVISRIGVDEALQRYDEHPGCEFRAGGMGWTVRFLSLQKAVLSTTKWGDCGEDKRKW